MDQAGLLRGKKKIRGTVRAPRVAEYGRHPVVDVIVAARTQERPRHRVDLGLGDAGRPRAPVPARVGHPDRQRHRAVRDHLAGGGCNFSDGPGIVIVQEGERRALVDRCGLVLPEPARPRGPRQPGAAQQRRVGVELHDPGTVPPDRIRGRIHPPPNLLHRVGRLRQRFERAVDLQISGGRERTGLAVGAGDNQIHIGRRGIDSDFVLDPRVGGRVEHEHLISASRIAEHGRFAHLDGEGQRIGVAGGAVGVRVLYPVGHAVLTGPTRRSRKRAPAAVERQPRHRGLQVIAQGAVATACGGQLPPCDLLTLGVGSASYAPRAEARRGVGRRGGAAGT